MPLVTVHELVHRPHFIGKLALEQLPKLRGAQVHSTVMLSEVDRKTFQKLGIGLTCDPVRKIKKQQRIVDEES